MLVWKASMALAAVNDNDTTSYHVEKAYYPQAGYVKGPN